MAPKSGLLSEEAGEGAPLPLADGEPLGGDPGPPASVPSSHTDTLAPGCLQDTKPPSPPAVSSATLRLAPESLDPRTLQLLWGQRELEIRALRWAVQNGQDARQRQLLQEVAGFPPQRSPRSQQRFLQNQVRKLRLELREQKQQAQREKELLEQRLHQLEAELQTFQKSCLLQMARSSWVGRVLRSQTGSVEVVTTEALVDPSDSVCESDQVPTAGEGFRLEDVDWNSIAHRYPNLFTSIESQELLPQTPTLLDPGRSQPDERPHAEERPHKTVEWSSLPRVGTSSSGGAGSDSSSCQLDLSSRAPKEDVLAKKLSGAEPLGMEGLQITQYGRLSKAGLEPDAGAQADPPRAGPGVSPSYSLKIVAVSRRQKFVRILNQSLEHTADMAGLTLRQLEHGFPVCLYRFPPGTLLAPRHQLTVWGEDARSAEQPPAASSGREPLYFRVSPGCVTLLLGREGEVLSRHQAPHCVTPTARLFAEDSFPLPEAQPGADMGEPRCPPRRLREARLPEAPGGRGRLEGGLRVPRGLPPLQASPQGSPPSGPPGQAFPRTPRRLARRPRPSPRLCCLPLGRLRPSGPLDPSATLGALRTLTPGESFHPREEPARPESSKYPAPELLNFLLEARLGLQDCQARKEHRVQVGRRSVDRDCPMVVLSVQNTAESRFGFRFLCCPPITADARGRR
ncbi:lamin tail domain-containing protein 2 [Oryctolagus cuniculus]|uniref:lamin tail domain-containing protein 2 n=1 Tax=Oryctolagus cuniculus TaxID=9986 RepID=UPI00223269F0|nr:lamin tail domain-containing protein 2 [Oryctolagus cuniculus]XP_051686868.1 lamin tail domain-containing protein 2 [Oryctolagus cuniculus]XP_051686869.1 lamin tail domain-containing protein 2 [Oryctolagus cuniculus]